MFIPALLMLSAILVLLVLRVSTGAWVDQGLTDEAGNEATYLDGLTLHLFSNNITFTSATVIGSLTECTFPGYAAVAVSGATPGSITTDTIPIVTTAAIFTRTSTGSSQNAYGCYLTNGSGQLVAGCTFAAPGPYAFANAGDTLSVPTTVDLTRV